MEEIAPRDHIYCSTEYGTLKTVIVAPPTYMKITEAINETQKHYKDANIDQELALRQHEGFVQLLREEGVDVLELPVSPSLHEQVFTRDIAFVAGDRLLLASMEEDIRRGETEVLKQWLDAHDLPCEEAPAGYIEGGDVLVDEETIWVGRARRTTIDAVEDLKRRFPHHRIKPLSLEEEILHLDCVFSILSEETAIVYSPAFSEEGLRDIESRFNTIPVTEEERFYMGPNVLSLGNGTIISLPSQKRLNNILREKGFRVIEHDFSEIIKSGGSFRCCTLPLQRT